MLNLAAQGREGCFQSPKPEPECSEKLGGEKASQVSVAPASVLRGLDMCRGDA